MENGCGAAAVTALACMMAEMIDDNDELQLLASYLMQLSDTLISLALQRAKNDRDTCKTEKDVL